MNTNSHESNGTAGRVAAQGSDARGFTRTDLAVLMAVLGLLGMVLLPALAGDRTVNETYRCLNNLRQLSTAWVMYSGDNSDKICRTGGTQSTFSDPYQANTQPGQVLANWVLGRDAADPNPDFIRNGLLFAYVQELSVYKCPADLRTVNGVPTLRSVSMNAWMNPISGAVGDTNYVVFLKQTDIRLPAATWLLIDENRYINDGWFRALPERPIQWQDMPAIQHHGGAGIAFADNHVEMKRWTDSAVLREASGGSRADTNSTDLVWLLERTTYPR